MIKKINGKTYNTDTAEKIAHHAVGRYGEETGYEEVLYKTTTGAYFMYTYGGAASKYAEESISAIDVAAAKAFAEKHHPHNAHKVTESKPVAKKAPAKAPAKKAVAEKAAAKKETAKKPAAKKPAAAKTATKASK